MCGWVMLRDGRAHDAETGVERLVFEKHTAWRTKTAEEARPTGVAQYITTASAQSRRLLLLLSLLSCLAIVGSR